MQLLLQEFHGYCSDQNWRIIFIQTNDRYQSEYAGIGLRKLLIGSDAVINLETFTKDTIHNKYFRNIVNRFSKARFKFVISRPPHSEKLLADISSISASWLTLPHRKEWSFLTGRLDSSYLRQVTVFVLQDASGAAQTFINQLPSYKHGTATIDLMRHRADAPPNSIDYLFICLLRHLKAEGYKDFNLGMSPLDANPAQNEYAARLLNHSYRLANRFIGFQGLHQFKAKYKPAWEPRYVWYQGGIHLLPQYGLAIFRLMHRPQ